MLNIETVHQCNCCMGGETLHPLVSAIDLSKANLTDYSIKFNFYTILLIENQCNDFAYGRKHYDYSNATLLFFAPGQSIEMDERKPFPQKGWLLAFHPRLISGTSLGLNINKYTFFSYHINEALHLSSREKLKVMECLNSIDMELQHPIDRHSQTIISRYVELLLDYCHRYYERQFITRNNVNKQILGEMELLLDEYIESGKLRSKLSPTVDYCSSKMQLSPLYFNDLLKYETGKTLDVYFQLKRIEIAKRMLLKQGSNVGYITEMLGFPNVQYFSKLFQKITGTTPSKYRTSQN